MQLLSLHLPIEPFSKYFAHPKCSDQPRLNLECMVPQRGRPAEKSLCHLMKVCTLRNWGLGEGRVWTPPGAAMAKRGLGMQLGRK